MKFLLAMFLVLAISGPSAFADSESKRQNILIKLDNGTNDLHSAFMAIKIGKVLLKKKNKVSIFANLEGVRLFHEHQPLNLNWGKSKKTFSDHYKEFISLGGKVLICPHCADAIGMPSKDLKKGTKIADEKIVAELFMNADKVISY